MYIMLQQLDITLNQCYNSYFDNEEEKYNHNHINSIYKRIQRRYDQLENLKTLINENLSDEDFYRLASKTYYFTFRNQKFLKSNIILSTKYDNLMLQVRVNSNYNFDINKCYSIKELEELFEKESILFESIFITEDNVINDKSNFIECSDEEFSKYYIRLKNLETVISKKNLLEVKSVLTKDRLMKDYKRLLKQTEEELGYLSKKFGNEIKLEL